MSNNKIDHDGHWKMVIGLLFKDFVKLSLPELYPLLDFSVAPIFLEQEFQEITATEGKKGNTYNDKLIKCRRKDGKDQHILLQVEIQSSRDATLPSRMHKYFYRIRDRFGVEVTSLAVYAHDDVPENHNIYTYECCGTRLVYEFNAIRIKDFPEEELLASDNPFALVILACQYLNKTKSDKNKRLVFKKKLADLLDEKGYSDFEKHCLLTFIRFMLKLPKNLELQYFNHILEKNIMPKSLEFRNYADFLSKRAFGESTTDIIAARDQAETKLFTAVKTLLSKGMTVEEVANAFSLPLEEIKKIKGSL